MQLVGFQYTLLEVFFFRAMIGYDNLPLAL